jgi:mercuric reductase
MMLRAAQMAQDQRHQPFSGLSAAEPEIDGRPLLRQRQERIAEIRSRKYQRILDDHEAITLLRGEAEFSGPKELTVRSPREQHRLTPDRILIATGASAVVPPLEGLLGTPFWTSSDAVQSDEIPPRLIVIGGSAVAVEQAQAFARLGSRVIMLVRSRLLPKEDPILGIGLRDSLRDEGIEVRVDTAASGVSYERGLFSVTVDQESLQAERLLIATGRRPNTRNLNLSAAGVLSDANGAVLVDEYLRTSAPDVFATGDCTPLPQFVYVAAAGGTRAAQSMHGDLSALDLKAMPSVFFTDPQVATVGMSDAQALEQGIAAESRTLDMSEVPRALANFDERGVIKLVVDTKSRALLGAQILAPEAGEFIQTAALAVGQGLTVEEVGNMLFPYLVYAEAIKLCAQTFSRDVATLSCCAG